MFSLLPISTARFWSKPSSSLSRTPAVAFSLISLHILLLHPVSSRVGLSVDHILLLLKTVNGFPLPKNKRLNTDCIDPQYLASNFMDNLILQASLHCSVPFSSLQNSSSLPCQDPSFILLPLPDILFHSFSCQKSTHSSDFSLSDIYNYKNVNSLRLAPPKFISLQPYFHCHHCIHSV